MKTFTRFRILRVIALLLGVLAVPFVAHAQTATVSGTVTDSSGGFVSDAAVTATNVGTGEVRTTVSGSTGFYSLSNLSPAVYVITFAKSGFKTVKFENLTLTVDQTLSLDCKFEVGSLSATVEVSSSAVATIDTETPTLSNVVSHTQMTELPLILRDPYQLVLLGPGVTQSDGLGGVSINGGRERNNNFLLDGTDNNDTEVPGNLGGITTQNPDATQEFRVLTNNYAPEFGRNNGGIIDVITRSGTNEFHGNLFYFGRWDALGARDYFNHTVNPDTGETDPKNPYVRNLYGGSFGGPIIKDKTFFFVNYQGARFVTTLQNVSTVPTDAFKTGIFTYTNPNGGATQALNVTAAGLGNNATGVGLDPTVQQILSFYPTPTVQNGDGVTGLLFFPSQSREKDEDATIKVDHRLTKNTSLYVRYVYNWFSDPNPFHSDILPGDLGAIDSSQRTQSLSVGLTTTIAPTLTNEFRFGANRTNLKFGCTGVGTFDGIGNGSFIDPQGNGADFNLPGFAGFGCQGLGDANNQARRTGTYQYIDNMTKVVGTHTFKWGGEYRDVYSNNFTDFGSRAAYGFVVFSDSGVPTLQGLNPGVGTTAIENMVGGLLGLVDSVAQTQFYNNAGVQQINDELNFRQHEFGVYFQDTWKVKSNLSLTYGLRWEYYGVPYEANGDLSNLYEDSSGPVPASGFFTFTPVGPGTGHQLYKDYYKNFDPRVGFAWDPFKTGRTSVRGGFGVFTDRVYGNLISDARGNPPFQPSFNNFPTFFDGPIPSSQLQNQTPPPPVGSSPDVPNGAFIFPDLFDHNIKSPLVTTWNIGIQRELATNLTVEVNYVGNHGTRILRVVDGNPPQPALVSQALANGVDPASLQFGANWFGANPVVNNTAFLQAFLDESSGHSWYDGLQSQISLRNFHGLQIQGAYTYSHALDDSSDPLVATVGNRSFPRNSFDLPAEKGNSGFDTRQRGVINWVYMPNIGRGKGHMNEGFVGRALEGWEISGVASFQTGLPYDIFGIVDTLHTGLSDRATLDDATLLHVTPSMGNVSPSTAVFTGVNPAAFNPDDGSVPIPFGIKSNVGRNHWYGPGINNWDVNLAKTTNITERLHFQLRFEFYNLFNRTQFGKPDDTIGDSNFGYSTSQVGQNDGTTGARQVQIGAKLQF